MDSNNLSETYLKRRLYIALTPFILLSAGVWFTSDNVAIILASTFHIYLYAIFCYLFGYLYSQSIHFDASILRNLSIYIFFLTCLGILLTYFYNPPLGLTTSLIGLWVIIFLKIPEKIKRFFPIWFEEFTYKINVIACICIIIMLTFWLNPYSEPLTNYLKDGTL